MATPSEMANIQVSPQERDIINQILKTHVPSCEVWAFGSRVTGTTKSYSGLDLAVITSEPLSLHDYAFVICIAI